MSRRLIYFRTVIAVDSSMLEFQRKEVSALFNDVKYYTTLQRFLRAAALVINFFEWPFKHLVNQLTFFDFGRGIFDV